MSRLTPEQQEAYEWGEIEREAARSAEFVPRGGWFYRFFRWCERIARENREELREQIKDNRP